MKNYELMAILEKLPSGMEIKTSGVVGCAEVVHREVVDQDDGEVMYSLSYNVKDVDQDGKLIYLLLE